MKRIAISDNPPRRYKVNWELLAYLIFYSVIFTILGTYILPWWLR